MPSIAPLVRLAVKQRLLRRVRRCRQAGLRLRYLIVINFLGGRGADATAAALGVHNTTVYRVARRFREQGEWGLLDGREDNGTLKLEERYLDALYRVVRSCPQQHGCIGRRGRASCSSSPFPTRPGSASMSPR
jgi:hypothetical protein